MLTNGPIPLLTFPGGIPVAQLTGAGHGPVPDPIVPEPMSVVILGSGLAGIFLARKKLVRG